MELSHNSDSDAAQSGNGSEKLACKKHWRNRRRLL